MNVNSQTNKEKYDNVNSSQCVDELTLYRVEMQSLQQQQQPAAQCDLYAAKSMTTDSSPITVRNKAAELGENLTTYISIRFDALDR